MTDDRTHRPGEINVDNVERLVENVLSIIGEPVIRNGEKMVKDAVTGECYPVHVEMDSSQIQDIKSKIHYL